MSVVVRFTYAANKFSDSNSDIDSVFEVFTTEGHMLHRVSVLKFEMDTSDLIDFVRLETSHEVLGKILEAHYLDFVLAVARHVVRTYWSFRSDVPLKSFELEMSKD
jgi:hypothetical protein